MSSLISVSTMEKSNILQIYNWGEESSKFLEECQFEKVIIANAFRQSDYKRVSIIFPGFYIQLIPITDAQAFLDKYEKDIFFIEDCDMREAVYDSKMMRFKKFYTKKRIYESEYFSGNSLHDIFFNFSRINPSAYIQADKMLEHFKPKTISRIENDIEVTEDIIFVKFSSIKLFADCTISPREELGGSIIAMPCNLLAFDMEVFFNNGGITFVSPDKDSDIIICISAVLTLNTNARVVKFLQSIDSSFHSAVSSSTCITFSFYHLDPVKKISIEELSNNVFIIHCISEEQLINSFIKLFHYADLHHVTGHNVIGFDLKFLHGRIKHLKERGKMVNQLLVKRCMISEAKEITIRSMKSIKRIADVADDSGSVVVIDFMNYAKKYCKTLTSFSLAACSSAILSWKAKLVETRDDYLVYSLSASKALQIQDCAYVKNNNTEEVIECKQEGDKLLIHCDDIDPDVDVKLSHCKADFDLVEAFARYDYECHIKCVKYCIHDSRLSTALYQVEDIHNSVLTYSMFNNMTQSQVTIYENNRSVTAIMIQKLTDEKLVLRLGRDNNEKQYKAAYVQEPSQEFIEDPVLVYDIDSQYPNSFIAGNLSYETIVETYEFDNQLDCMLKANQLRKKYKTRENHNFFVISSTTSDKEIIPSFYVTVFDRRTPGVIPKMLKELLVERIERKNIISSLKKLKPASEIEKAIIADKINFQSRVEKALKLVLNSTYGFLGSKFFDLSNPALARSCTAIGVIIIKHLIQMLHVDITLLVDTTTNEILEWSLDYNTELIRQPFDFPSLHNSMFKKSIQLDHNKDQAIIRIKSLSAYTDTDSCFQQCKIYDLQMSEKSKKNNVTLDVTKPNTNQMMKIIFKLGNLMFKIINEHFLLGLFRLKFEKMLTYLNIIKKRYSSYIFTAEEDIDAPWTMLQSGGSLVQRSTNRFHKSVIIQLENFIRKLIIAATPIHKIRELLDAEIQAVKEKALADIKTGALSFKDFMRTRGFRKTKNIKFKIYQTVLKHNQEVLSGTSQSKIPYISEGERYFTILLVDENDPEPLKNKVTDCETIIAGTQNESIEGKRIFFEHYWELIENDINKRYSIWK